MDACLDVRAVHAEPIAAEYDVAFSFVVHNGAVYLDKSLGELVSIGRQFRRFWIFYVENDSTDGTQLILTKFGAAHPDTLHGEMLRNFANS
jgi:glycosyltransferase involved in cell wall biosynthesis